MRTPDQREVGIVRQVCLCRVSGSHDDAEREQEVGLRLAAKQEMKFLHLLSAVATKRGSPAAFPAAAINNIKINPRPDDFIGGISCAGEEDRKRDVRRGEKM